MASISTPNLRETARGAVQYRHLVTFILSLNIADHRSLLASDKIWDEVLAEAKIVEIREEEPEKERFRGDIYLVTEDGTFYTCRYPRRFFDDMRTDWGSFIQLQIESRMAIVDALSEDRDFRRHSAIRYVSKNIDEYFEARNLRREMEASSGSLLKQFEITTLERE